MVCMESILLYIAHKFFSKILKVAFSQLGLSYKQIPNFVPHNLDGAAYMVLSMETVSIQKLFVSTTISYNNFVTG